MRGLKNLKEVKFKFFILFIILFIIFQIKPIYVSYAWEVLSYGRKDVYLDFTSSNDWLAIQALSDTAGIKYVTVGNPFDWFFVGQAVSFSLNYDYARQLPGTPIILVPGTEDHRIRVRVILTPSPTSYWSADGYDNSRKGTPSEPLKTALDYLLYLTSLFIKVPIPPIPWGLVKEGPPKIVKSVDNDYQGFKMYYNNNPSLQGTKYAWVIMPNPNTGIIEEGYYWIAVYTEASAGYYALSQFYYDEPISIWLSAGFYVIWG